VAIKPHLAGAVDQKPFMAQAARRLGSRSFLRRLRLAADGNGMRDEVTGLVIDPANEAFPRLNMRSSRSSTAGLVVGVAWNIQMPK
jgi:hypothetical protein